MRGTRKVPLISIKRMMKKMKDNYLIFSLTFLLLCNSSLLSQTFEDDPDTEEIDGTEIVIDETNVGLDVLNNVLNGFGISSDPSALNPNLNTNSVFIQQIGDFNQASIFTSTVGSDINISQQGESNAISLDYRTNTAIANITQLGNENTLIDFVINPIEDISLDLQQQGDNLTFERFGTNSITRSLQFIQTEASPTLIIRSFQ